MDNVQKQSDPLPKHPRFQMKAISLITVIITSTIIAVIWALSDTGHIGGYWGKLALIFFTWLAVIMTAIALSHTKE